MVIAEDNSFGLPAITSDVGGIPTAVRNGLNGAAFPLEAFVEQAGAFILKTMQNTASYRQLAAGAFGQYEERLNWDVAGKRVRELLEAHCAPRNTVNRT